MKSASVMAPLPPGSTVGVLGGGQLARMLAMEARRMEYRVRVLDPDPNCCAAPVSDAVLCAPLDDVAAARALASQCDVLTVDTEHVPADLLEELESVRPVRPGSHVLRVVQDRLVQRRFLSSLGLDQPRHAAVSSREDLEASASQVGFPCVLKTRRSGYDGKGQALAHDLAQLTAAWERLEGAEAVLESFVDFQCEVSVVLARGAGGEERFFPVAENEHRNHVLYLTRAPARISPALAAHAQEMAAKVARAFGHVGILAVEFFVTRDGQLLINEVAPRTHNSGHFTLGGCLTSQFEQHLRAICGLRLLEPTPLRRAAMVNLMGDLWSHGEPDFRDMLNHDAAQLHLYGKGDARPGRKMGHLLVLARDADDDPARIADELLQRCAGAGGDRHRKPGAGSIPATHNQP